MEVGATPPPYVYIHQCAIAPHSLHYRHPACTSSAPSTWLQLLQKACQPLFTPPLH